MIRDDYSRYTEKRCDEESHIFFDCINGKHHKKCNKIQCTFRKYNYTLSIYGLTWKDEWAGANENLPNGGDAHYRCPG